MTLFPILARDAHGLPYALMSTRARARRPSGSPRAGSGAVPELRALATGASIVPVLEGEQHARALSLIGGRVPRHDLEVRTAGCRSGGVRAGGRWRAANEGGILIP